MLTRCRINRLSRIDRVTSELIRRYEHPHPGSLIHVDVTKFGNIPDGGGWRYVGKEQGDRNRAATKGRTGSKNARYQPRLGHAFVHTVIDDCSRIAYAEIRDDEKADAAVLQRASVRHVRLHDARHSAATFLLMQGVDRRTAMALMGWAHAEMADRYQHAVTPLRAEAAVRVEQLLWSGHHGRQVEGVGRFFS